MTRRECCSCDWERGRARNGGSRLKGEEENKFKREQKRAEESGMGIESRIADNMQCHALISCILCIYSLKYNHKCIYQDLK